MVEPEKEDTAINTVSNNQDSSSDEEEEAEVIVYPSQKLSALTKKRNKLLKHLKTPSPGNIAKVKVYLIEFQSKIKEFAEACCEQLNRSDVSTTAKLEMNNWYIKHLEVNEKFEVTTATWIKDAESGNACDLNSKNSTVASNPVTFNNSNDHGNGSFIHNQTITPDSLAMILKQQNEITRMLVENQARSMLPQAEPDTFDGSNILEYKSFILSFERTIAARTSDYADLYYNLKRYTKGEAYNKVRSCENTNVKLAYLNARSKLELKYGNECKLAEEYILKLEKWPNITKEDPKALRDLSTFLEECLSLMSDMSDLNQLNSTKAIGDIVKKLPNDYQRKFREVASDKMELKQRIQFRDLVKFLERKVRILETPVFGDLGRETQFQRKKAMSTSKSEQQDKDKPFCVCCKRRNHQLDSCFFFLKKNHEARRDFIKEKKLCFGCLKSTEHSSKNCQNRIVCKHCKATHPSSLHIEKNESAKQGTASKQSPQPSNSAEQTTTPRQESKDESTAPETSSSDSKKNSGTSLQAKTNISSSVIKSPAILVDVRLHGSSKIIRTYLGLDTFCDSTYIDTDLVRQAGIDPKLVTFSLTTLKSTDEPDKFGHVKGIEIISLDRSSKTTIEKAFVPNNWPFRLEDSPKVTDTRGYEKLRTLPISYENVKIGILIGQQRTDILRPLQTVSTTKRGPYATRHSFGWAINGPITGVTRSGTKCLRTQANLAEFRQLDRSFQSVFARDFADVEEENQDSVEDKRWRDIAHRSLVKLPNNHIQMNLPFKKEDIVMPNNFDQAYSRLMNQKSHFRKNTEHFENYCKFIDDMLKNNYAEIIPTNEIDSVPIGKKWYLVHFSVIHKTKKKLRVVFDCSLKFNGVSLNDVLLQGPDNTNSLVGVLLRFREGPIAFSADVKSMFYQVHVSREDSEYLRFLWFPDNDLTKTPIHYRLRVHVFGAKSSPSCASYALRHAATLGKQHYLDEVLETIMKNFYVDDALKACENSESAIILAHNLIKILEENGFDLTSFISNSRELLQSLPPEKLSKDLKQVNFSEEGLPEEKTLGMIWCPESDNFGCRLKIEDHPCTKRGLLKTLFSVFDPLFLASPAIINGKRIFQEACSLNLDWDEILPQTLLKRWKQWTSELPLLRNFKVPRCFALDSFARIELHVFSDGSYVAYGSVGYLRFVKKDGSAHTSIVVALARMTPIGRSSLKTISLKTPPRIELNAAKLSINLQQRILKEIRLKIERIFFWTDSVTTLNYIKSDSGRFKTFVANRVDFIRSKTHPNQWNHVPGTLNPADVLSRGTTVPKFLQNSLWLNGPSFLRDPNEEWPKQQHSLEVAPDDEEVAKKSFFATKQPNPVDVLLESTNNWSKLKYFVSIFLKFITFLQNKKQQTTAVDVSDLQNAELCIWRYVQNMNFSDVIQKLKQKKTLSKNQFSKLSPFIDSSNLLRARGRLQNSDLNEAMKYPILLPKKNPVVHSLFRHLHSRIGHLGREVLVAQIRKKYYVVGMSSLAYQITQQCIICRKILSRPSEQKMANLPSDRLQPDQPPFSTVGIDCFGPMFVTRGRGRSKEKRYGLILSCVASRAIHIEILHSLDTDSFINGLRRFVARRGPVQRIRCDNGTNFVSGKREIALGIKEWNRHQIESWCKAQNIEWHFNVPAAPHWGGLWERIVKTCKKILNSMTSEIENKKSLNDESLLTWICEVENIMNSRPITQITCDIDDKEALTPNHLLRPATERSFPPGIFSQNDLYSKRRWRQVQFLVDEFWTRWKKEYLPLLMSRQRWTTQRRSHEVDDLVLVVDQLLPRNLWCLGRITQVNRDKEGTVRSAEVLVSKHRDNAGNLAGTQRLQRPITKLILLKTQEELKKD